MQKKPERFGNRWIRGGVDAKTTGSITMVRVETWTGIYTSRQKRRSVIYSTMNGISILLKTSGSVGSPLEFQRKKKRTARYIRNTHWVIPPGIRPKR
eukprot:2189443-Pleurochrysis_carterae.AAC.1